MGAVGREGAVGRSPRQDLDEISVKRERYYCSNVVPNGGALAHPLLSRTLVPGPL